METHLVRFLAHYESKDGYYSMLSYVRLSTAVMQAQMRSIEDCKPPRKTKCGIINFVSNFLEFAQNTEMIFRGSDRRTDIEKWYLTLVTSMMDNIPRIAK